MGRGWSHNYNERILPLYSDAWRHLGGDNNVERYWCIDAPTCSTFRPQSKAGSILTSVGGGWELRAPNGTLKTFDGDGKLLSIESRSGSYQLISISYTSEDKVDVVMDQQGRSLQFAYNADGLVESVTLPSGTVLQYQYSKPSSVPAHVGWRQQLVKVIREDLSERIYHYEDQNPDTTPRYEFPGYRRD